jgi:pterin-4a-carbinolamine dehydratase
VLELLKDKEIEGHLVQLLVRVANDVEVKHELKELLKWAALQEDVKDSYNFHDYLQARRVA